MTLLSPTTCHYSNSNDSDEFLWAWNVPPSVNKLFPHCLKVLLNLKTRQVLWRTCNVLECNNNNNISTRQECENLCLIFLGWLRYDR